MGNAGPKEFHHVYNQPFSMKQNKGVLEVLVVGANANLGSRHSMLFKDPSLFVVVSLEYFPSGTRPNSQAKKESEHAQQLREKFEKWDDSGDGLISEEEFIQVVQSLPPPVMASDDLRKLFQVADRNRNGRLDYAEFISWICGDDKRLGDLGLPKPGESAHPVREFQTTACKHTSKPQWNQSGLLEISEQDRRVFVSIYDSFSFSEEAHLHTFEIDARPTTPKQELHLRRESDDGGAFIELDLVLRPDDGLLSTIEKCYYMPNITGELQTLSCAHWDETIAIKDFITSINVQHGMELELSGLYHVSYFGFMSGTGPEFHPLQDLADTTFGEQPYEHMVYSLLGDGVAPLNIMPKAVTVEVHVEGDVFKVGMDASLRMHEFLDIFKKQHGIDMTIPGWFFDVEREFMGQKTAQLVAIGDSDVWKGLLGQRVYQLLYMQHSRKHFVFASSKTVVELSMLSLVPMGNGSNVFGKVSISYRFDNIKLVLSRSSNVANAIGSQVGGLKSYLFLMGEKELEMCPDSSDYNGLERDHAEGKIVCFVPNTPAKHVPIGKGPSKESKAFKEAGDSIVSGFFFTKMVSDERKTLAVNMIEAFNKDRFTGGLLHVMRIHSDSKEDGIADEECSIM